MNRRQMDANEIARLQAENRELRETLEEYEREEVADVQDSLEALEEPTGIDPDELEFRGEEQH